MTWILSGIFSLLLFYANQHKPGTPEPNKALCIAQTSLLHGITPMWSVAILMLVYHMNLAFEGHVSTDRQMKVRMIFMLISPYIALIAFFVATLIASLAHPEKVTRSRRFFYCSLEFDPLSNTMAIFTLLVCFAITCLEVRLSMTLYRNWRGIRNAHRLNGSEIPLLLRVILFGIYVFFGMIVNAVSIFDSRSAFPDVFAATIGSVVLLIFGSQADVLRVWCFWKRSRSRPVALAPNLNFCAIDTLKSAHPTLASAGFGFGEMRREGHDRDANDAYDDNDDDLEYIVRDGKLVPSSDVRVGDIEKGNARGSFENGKLKEEKGKGKENDGAGWQDVKLSRADAEKRARDTFVRPLTVTPPPPVAKF
ncbi:hypothetical protein HGRIS_006091 [Hohenbuehelia grisea]